MSDTGTYKNLDYVVSRVQSDIQDYSTAGYQRLLQMAINGYKELNYAILPVIKTKYLTLSSINTIDFPCDYVDYVVVGLVSGGQVITLSANPKIPLARKKDDCGNEVVEKVSATQSDDSLRLPLLGFNYASSHRGGQYVGERYARGGGFNRYGYFRVDHDMRRFQFQNTIPNVEVLLEYKSTGIDAMGDALLPDYATQALVDYVHYQRLRFDRRATATDKAMAFQEYSRQFIVLRKKALKFTMSEYLDAKYANVHMGIKR